MASAYVALFVRPSPFGYGLSVLALGIRRDLPFNRAMMLLSILLVAAPLPLYPGATPKVFNEIKDPETKIYWVERAPKAVADWYAKRLRRSYRTETSDQITTYIVALKERRIKASGPGILVLEHGVAVWGAKGGTSFFALVDREISAGPIRLNSPGLRLDPGADAKVEKARGADPNRYKNDGLSGRSVRGRSVEGSFR